MSRNTHILYGHVEDDGSLRLEFGEVGAALGPKDHAIAGVDWNPQEVGIIERFALREFSHVLAKTEASVSAAAALAQKSLPATFKAPAGTLPGETTAVAGAIVQGRAQPSAGETTSVASTPAPAGTPTSSDGTDLVKTADLVNTKTEDATKTPVATVPAPGDNANAKK